MFRGLGNEYECIQHSIHSERNITFFYNNKKIVLSFVPSSTNIAWCFHFMVLWPTSQTYHKEILCFSTTKKGVLFFVPSSTNIAWCFHFLVLWPTSQTYDRRHKVHELRFSLLSKIYLPFVFSRSNNHSYIEE